MRLAEVEGIGTLEFPDDTPDEVIQQTVKKQIRAKSVLADKDKIKKELVDDTKSPFLTAIGRGFADVGQGINQLMLKYAYGPMGMMGRSAEGSEQAYTAKKDEELKQYQTLQEAHPISTGIGRVVGNVAATPVPGGVGANAMTRLGTAALSGAATAGAMYTPEGQSRAKNMAIGALTGSGTQGLLGEPLRALGRGATSTAQEALERSQVVDAGKRLNVPVFHPDVTSNPLAKESAILAERGGPLGTSGGRMRQATAAKEAAQQTLASMKGNYQLGDISDEIRSSLQGRFERFQKVKTAKYARVARVADTAGDIPTPKFDQTLAMVQQQAKSGGIPNPALDQKLTTIGQAPRGPFSVANTLEDDLGDEVSKFYAGGDNAVVGKKGVQYFQQLKQSLRADIEDHLKATKPQAIPMMKEADQFYKENILPFKRTQLGKIISDKSDFNPEQAWNFIEKNAGNKEMMGALYNSLSPRGRVAVKTGLMKEAFDAGMVNPQAGGAKVFSPGRVASYLDNKLELADQFLKPNEATEFKGMVKLFRAIQRSGQVSENPPTGARLLLPALIASSFWSPKGAVLVGGGLLAAKGLFTTEVSRKLLTQLAELPVDHPKTLDLVSQISASLRQRIPGPLVQPEIQEEE